MCDDRWAPIPAAGRAACSNALFEVKKVIVGQDRAIERLIVCLLARGHCLLEGVPGLAKTLAVETLATVVGGTFARLQFTPDLLPADIVGTRIYRASSETFDIELGPGLRQLRARRRDQPGAGQGAVGAARGHGRAPGVDRRPDLPGPRAVPRARHPEPDRVRGRLPAARGPARPLPHEDRRRLPDRAARRSRSSTAWASHPPEPAEVLDARRARSRLQAAADEVYVDRAVVDYAVSLVLATRYPEHYGLSRARPADRLRRQPPGQPRPRRRRHGRSPCCGAATYVLPQDVFDVAPDVLRHRLVLSYEALAQGVVGRPDPGPGAVDGARHRTSARPASSPALARRRAPGARAAALAAPAGRATQAVPAAPSYERPDDRSA